MKRGTHYLEYLYCLMLIIFVVGRIGFILYNRDIYAASFPEVLEVLKTGLISHDVVVVAYLLLIPGLVGLLTLRYTRLPLRAVLTPYYILMGFSVAVLIVADAIMYEFWQFKLGAVMLSYASSPEGATNSVSVGFIAIRALAVLTLALLIIVPCIVLTPRRMEVTTATRYWFRNLSIIWAFLLGMGFFMHVGDAYTSSRLFLNHAATNPVYSFAASFPWSRDYAGQYNFLDETERSEAFTGLYPEETEDVTDTLLTTQHPNVLVVFIESFGGKFIQEMGGVPGVAPNWSRLIPEGIFWDNYYSNSFRTDRGTVSAFSGYVSYPDVSLMTHTEMHAHLPSLAHTLVQKGYDTYYLYAGAMSNMGKKQYLQDMDFQHLMDKDVFSDQDQCTAWGYNDGTSAMKAFHTIAQMDSTQHWMMTYQTISSHEPWTVPYHRLEDEKLNAFAYTDSCVGALVDSLKTLPQWRNMLVILMPDHGFLYQQTYEDPLFFHSPMLWLGGAIREPRHMQVLMNQSDLAATLLSQMGISHRDYAWSRNVLSHNYRYPFVYCNFPTGVMFRDDSGFTMYDISAREVVCEEPTDPMGMRQIRGLSILQTSYDQLDELK